MEAEDGFQKFIHAFAARDARVRDLTGEIHVREVGVNGQLVSGFELAGRWLESFVGPVSEGLKELGDSVVAGGQAAGAEDGLKPPLRVTPGRFLTSAS
jgi:hypothetical protein